MPYDFKLDTRPKIKLSDIEVRSDRARKDFNHIMEIKNDIEELGLINPITVAKLANGKFFLLAGETRYRCAMLIPAMGGEIAATVRTDDSELRKLEIELSENVQRKALGWMEQIELMRQIDEIKKTTHGQQTAQNPEGWSLKKTADLAGVSYGEALKQVKLAKKLRDRPELVDKVKNFPASAATKVIEQIEEAERVQRLHSTGQLELTADLHSGDCRLWLKTLPDNSVDLILTDPPFGMDTIEENRNVGATNKPGQPSGVASSGNTFTARLSDIDNMSSGVALELLSAIAPDLFRVLRPSRHLYLFLEAELCGEIKSILTGAGFVIQWPMLIWDKTRSTSVFKGYSYMPAYESILFAYKPGEKEMPCRRLSESCTSILRFPIVHSNQKIHAFEKPPELLTQLIKVSTQFGDTVLDPFAGSASTLLTAKQMGRKAIGCEANQDHYLRAQGRLIIAAATAVPEVNP